MNRGLRIEHGPESRQGGCNEENRPGIPDRVRTGFAVRDTPSGGPAARDLLCRCSHPGRDARPCRKEGLSPAGSLLPVPVRALAVYQLRAGSLPEIHKCRPRRRDLVRCLRYLHHQGFRAVLLEPDATTGLRQRRFQKAPVRKLVQQPRGRQRPQGPVLHGPDGRRRDSHHPHPADFFQAFLQRLAVGFHV